MEDSTTTLLGKAKVLAIALMLLCLLGCKPQKALVEKVRVETRTEYVTDTIEVRVPEQSASVDTPKGESRLETDYAESNAWINEDGTLHHDLRNKARPIDVAYQMRIVYRDSVVEKPVAVEVPVMVDKPLTWWQKTQIKAFWFLIVITTSFFIVNRRKEIAKMIASIFR